MRKRARIGLLTIVAVLYVLSVPWYRETGAPVTIVGGLPDWVATALACYVLVAILNAAAWLFTEMDDDIVPPPGGSQLRSDAAQPPERESS